MLDNVDVAAAAEVDFAPQFALFLRSRCDQPVPVVCDGVSTLGHVVQSLGVPLTEVGCLTVNGIAAEPSYRPGPGDQVQVDAVPRPQRLAESRFVLDVHLGTLARRLRLLGIDAAYANDAENPRHQDHGAPRRHLTGAARSAVGASGGLADLAQALRLSAATPFGRGRLGRQRANPGKPGGDRTRHLGWRLELRHVTHI